MNCRLCGRELGGDDIGLTRKLVARDAEEYMCVPCIADYYKVDEAILRKKIEEFKADGCKLFG